MGVRRRRIGSTGPQLGGGFVLAYRIVEAVTGRTKAIRRVLVTQDRGMLAAARQARGTSRRPTEDSCADDFSLGSFWCYRC